MIPNPGELVLPRPCTSQLPCEKAEQHVGFRKVPIKAPSESSFTAVFGELLPPAQYLQTDNGNAAYYELVPTTDQGSLSGQGGPKRVLVLHGIQTPALGLFPLVKELQASFPQTHFVLLDLWGHGLSDTPYLPHDTDLFMSLLNQLLDKLEWSTFHLVGFSFGGVTTLNFVQRYSDRVLSYVLIAPGGTLRFDDFTPEQKEYLRGGGDESAARRGIIEWLEGGGPLQVPPDWEERVAKGEVVAKALRQWQTDNHAGHTASCVAMVRDGSIIDNQEAFRNALATNVPSLAVIGGEDALCTRKSLEEVRFSNVVVVPGADHAGAREKTNVVAPHLLDFWRSLPNERVAVHA